MSIGYAILKIRKFDEISEEFIRCPSRSHVPGFGAAGAPVKDEVIPVFYSTQHMLDSGWVYTNDRQFSPSGQGVWVCPKCASKYSWGTHESQ